MKRHWDEERRKLLGDQAIFKDAANRLNMEVQDARDRARAGEGVQGELEQAKKAIGDLEEALRTERSMLRMLTTVQGTWDREKQDILFQLRRTESVRCSLVTWLHELTSEHDRLAGYGGRKASTPACQAEQR